MGVSEGIIVKMPVRLDAGMARYTLRLEQPRSGAERDPQAEELDLDAFLGEPVRIEHTGEYICTRCGRRTNRPFGEGFCFPCFRDAPEAAECIVKPELCRAHLEDDQGRDPQWERDHHFQPHVVYFARSSALKVGVTRSTQIPTRWIDQGAAWAVAIARVPYRQLAGLMEVALKEIYTDRTAWQRMLKGELSAAPEELAAALPSELARVHAHLSGTAAELLPYLLEPEQTEPLDISYPVREVPRKVKAVSLAKTPVLESVLQGIRGQYLIFDGGAVLNVRRHSGFVVRVTRPR